MYQKTVTLDNSDRLLIEWGENLSNMTIKKENALIGSFSNKDEVKQGRSFMLPDRRQITVVYSEYGLEVWQNGKELVSGAKSGEINGIVVAQSGLFVIGAIQLGMALFTYFSLWETSVLVPVIVGAPGLVLISLGIWTKISTNKIPYKIGIGICALSLILWHNLFGLILLGGLIYYLTLAVKSKVQEPARQLYADPDEPLDSGL